MKPVATICADGAAARPDRLPLVPLGQTGLTVSVIGLGLAGLGRPGYMALGRDDDLGADRSVAAMRHRCSELLDSAYQAGVTYVDTARSYGLAEQFVRAWWEDRRLRDSALVVGSKWGYAYAAAWQVDAHIHEIKSLTVDTLRAQIAESRAMLGCRLSLYQIHSATIESGVLDDLAVRRELMRLREQGLRVGLTTTGPRQAETIRRALDIRCDGVALFQTVQSTWNLLEPSAAPALADASAAGVGVIVKEVLGNGRLTSRHGGRELRALSRHAQSLGGTVEMVAIAAALAQPWADVVVSGAVTRDQLQASVAALAWKSRAWPAPAIAERPEIYWQRRRSIPWS